MKTNNTFFFFLFIFLQLQFVSGQTTVAKEIHGQITADSVAVEAVNVINTTTQKATSANSNGEFAIFVKEGDVLSFSAVNLVTLRRNITKQDVLLGTISVKMVTQSIPLKEVVVKESDAINAQNLGIVPYGQKKYTPAERKLYTARSGLLDRPLNWVSGRTKQLKKQVEVEQTERAMVRLEYLFEEKYYIETLKIPKDYIRGFQYYCVENPDFVAALESKNKTLSMFLIITLAKEYNKITVYEN